MLDQVGVGVQDLSDGLARRDEPDDRADAHASATHARLPAHHIDGACHAIEGSNAQTIAAGGSAGWRGRVNFTCGCDPVWIAYPCTVTTIPSDADFSREAGERMEQAFVLSKFASELVGQASK